MEVAHPPTGGPVARPATRRSRPVPTHRLAGPPLRYAQKYAQNAPTEAAAYACMSA